MIKQRAKQELPGRLVSVGAVLIDCTVVCLGKWIEIFMVENVTLRKLRTSHELTLNRGISAEHRWNETINKTKLGS